MLKDICDCIDSINAIDDSVFLAECSVINTIQQYDDKLSLLVENCDDINSMSELIQEADMTGTRRRSHTFIDKIITFIRRCINKIIDMISDFMMKMKTRKFEYIEVPYEPKALLQDLITANEIDMTIMEALSNIETDPNGTLSKVKAIQKDLDKISFFKLKESNKRYGLKREIWLEIREKIRALNRSMKDNQKYMESYHKKLTSYYIRIVMIDEDGSKRAFDSRGKNPETFVEILNITQNIYAKLATFSTKVMASFKFRGVNKITPEQVNQKLSNLESHAKSLRELVEYNIIDISVLDDDNCFFTETSKPYDEYLKKHDYNSEDNTIEINGRRVNAGRVPSAKERNRINRFLRENNYDPETETIQTDVKDKNGGNKRIKFNMHKDQFAIMGPAYYGSPDLGDDEQAINMHSRELFKKPRSSNQTFKHEEGHFDQHDKGHAGRTVSLLGGEYGYINPTEEQAKKTSKFLQKDENISGSAHQTPAEHGADLYGYQHNPYASTKEGRSKTQLQSITDNNKRRTVSNVKNTGKQMKKNENLKEIIVDNLEEEIRLSKRDIKNALKDIDQIEKLLQQDDDYIEYSGNDRKTLISDLESSKKGLKEDYDYIEKCEKRLAELNGMNDITKTDEYHELAGEIDSNIGKAINSIYSTIEIIQKENKIRDKFLDENSEEAGSRARKLEGRQGKHKGKK